MRSAAGIVTKLALSSPQVAGLTVTRATLNALLKYPWTRQSDGDRKQKYGLYQTEKEDFDFARELQPIPGDIRKSAEAEIIGTCGRTMSHTGAVQRVPEDFYRARMIGLVKMPFCASAEDDEMQRKRFFDGMHKERPELKKQLGEEPSFRPRGGLFALHSEHSPISEPLHGHSRSSDPDLRYFSSYYHRTIRESNRTSKTLR